MADLAWMRRLLEEAPVKRVGLGDPMRLKVGEAAWILATDGTFLVAVSGEDPALAEPPPSIRDRVAAILSYAPSQALWNSSAAALKEWAGAPHRPKDAPCGECGGKGDLVCRECGGTGLYDRVCDDCDHVHLCRCPSCDGGRYGCRACDGLGKEDGKRPIRPGLVAGFTVDRELLARVLECAPFQGEISVASWCNAPWQSALMLAVAGTGFRLFQMPLELAGLEAPGTDFVEEGRAKYVRPGADAAFVVVNLSGQQGFDSPPYCPACGDDDQVHKIDCLDFTLVEKVQEYVLEGRVKPLSPGRLHGKKAFM